MKIVRYGEAGHELPGLVDRNGGLRALSPLVTDIDARSLTPQWLSILRAIDVDSLPLVDGTPRLGVPAANIRQVIAIGLNYRDHAEETGMAIPDYPMVFYKSIGSLAGAQDPIAVPVEAEKLDWEVELAFLIGSVARFVDRSAALSHVAGYMVATDVSERAWQVERGGQFGKGKSFDAFTPVGPYLVTPDEIDAEDIPLWLDVNGERVQDGRTSSMIFTVAEIVSHLSQYQTLLPGDLILTGTPAGVGHGFNPPRYLRAGDSFSCGIDGLGSQHHQIKTLR